MLIKEFHNCDLDTPVRKATRTLSKWVFPSTRLYFFLYTFKKVFSVTQRDETIV